MATTISTRPYSIVARSNRLVDVTNPEGRTYRVALDEGGHALLCTCPASAHRGNCKHLAMVVDRLRDGGLPLAGGGRLVIRPGVGMVEEGRRDPFARFETDPSFRRLPPGRPGVDGDYDPMAQVETRERRNEQAAAALDGDEVKRAADYYGQGR